MVCPRCIEAVNELLISLNIGAKSVVLGEVVLEKEISTELKKRLEEKLELKGFELLQDHKSKLIGQIKAIIIDKIHHQNEQLITNFSNYISEKLHHDYSYLSRLFSSVEGITIEKFIVKQKIERVKEFLFYNELTLSEIAFKMNYSSVAYLSSQFKKETGMTPSEFKQLKKPGHHSLDSF